MARLVRIEQFDDGTPSVATESGPRICGGDQA
ncbi:hypothetical protein SAMN06272737_106144 [Blastococcus mobilis]|uniref:Uncharacterized protein n=1 Tax=Blastococcus mobilis TaxID=1938746 RepID=A0A238W5V9_9ACTN|nr:hypothetical protein SAMN06272737_106144 [Blastococcus mobilis]